MKPHKLNVIFHLRGGQSVKIPAYSFSTQKRGDELLSYEIHHCWRQKRKPFYGRLDSIDFIETCPLGWWRWAW